MLEEEKRNKLDLDLILGKLGITQKEAEEFRRRELKFQKKVTGKRMSMGEIRAAIGTYCVNPGDLMERHLQEILDKRIQVYFDTGRGFCEEDSYYIPDVYVGPDIVEAEIPFDGNVNALRIDPADRCCVVKICEILLNQVPVPLSKKHIVSNGKALTGETYVFATSDPNFTVKVSALPRQAENILSVRMNISPLSQEIAQDMERSARHLF